MDGHVLNTELDHSLDYDIGDTHSHRPKNWQTRHFIEKPRAMPEQNIMWGASPSMMLADEAVA